MQYLNIASYKFIPLNNLAYWQTCLFNICQEQNIKGTVLLSTEGINIAIAGSTQAIQVLTDYLYKQAEFNDMQFRKSYSATLPFKRLKIKIKPEIITFKQPQIDATKIRASSITPETLKKWLDEKKPFTLLDTRNDYEIQFGTFKNATHLGMQDFSEFPQKLPAIDKGATVVMFCTGGIRCEKAALYMQAQGYKNVLQLQGGILNYFAHVGGEHYQGNCFVFDERITVNSQLEASDRLP